MTDLSNQAPFVGLRPFEVSDHHWFRGRTQEIATLLRKVRRNRFTAVVGASGSGKSSLVKAGILPLLEKDDWKIVIVKPGSAPISKLALALSETARDDEIDTLAEARNAYYDTTLRQSAFGLVEIADRLTSDGQRLLLVVDQFEELFRYGDVAQGLKKAAMEEEARALVELLLTAVTQRAGRLHVIITMRSDYFGHCAAYSGLAEAVSTSQYLVPLPDRDQLEVIIREPIAEAGDKIDNILVQRLLLDVAEEADLLPTLQHTLRRLWEVAQGKPRWLREEDYRTIGGITGSINSKAEQLVTTLIQSHKEDFITLERAMKALTELDEQGRATRLPQKRSILLGLVTEVLGDQKAADTSLNRVLNTLASEEVSFIQLGTGEDPEIDIGHESLIRSWRRLCGEDRHFRTGWLMEEREDKRQWWNLVRRVRNKESFGLVEVWRIHRWIKKKKIGALWWGRYGDTWKDFKQFYRKSIFKRILFTGLITVPAPLVFLILALLGIVWAYEKSEEYIIEQVEIATNYTKEGHSRLGALVALNLIQKNLHKKPEQKNKIISELANALIRPIEIIRINHEWHVHSVAFSPDGKLLVSGDEGYTLQLWDAHSGAPIGKPLSGHDGWIKSVAFSPDSKRLVSGSWDNTLRLWDAHSGAPIGKPLSGHEEEVTSVAFSPDGKLLVSGSADKTIILWDAQNRKAIGKPLRGHEGEVTSVAFSPDGKLLVSGSADKTIILWDAQSRKAIGKPLRGHEWEVTSVAFSPNGKRLVSGSADNTLRRWDALSGEPIGESLRGHESGVTSVAFSPDGKRLVSGSWDNTLRLWNARSGAAISAPLRGHETVVTSVAFSPDGKRLVSGSRDINWNLRIWKYTYSEEPIGKPLRGHKGTVTSVAFSPDGKRLVSGSWDNTLRLWDAHSGEPIGELLLSNKEIITSIAFSHDGKHLALGNADNTLRLWDIHNGEVGKPLSGHKGTVTSVAFSPNDEQLVSGSADHTLRMWNVRTGVPIAELLGHEEEVTSVAFSPDGKRLVSGSADTTIILWDAQDRKAIGKPLSGHKWKVSSVAFSPDGKRLVSGSWDGTLRLWDSESGKKIDYPLFNHGGMVTSVAFSPDGERLVSGGRDHMLQIWDAHSGAPIGAPLLGHEGGVESVAFSVDGKRLVSGSADHTLLLWNVDIPSATLVELTKKAEKLCPLSLDEHEKADHSLYFFETQVTDLTRKQRHACGVSSLELTPLL